MVDILPKVSCSVKQRRSQKLCLALPINKYFDVEFSTFTAAATLALDKIKINKT